MNTKERPILFSGPMVKAILEGRKTQTRRVVKPQPIFEGIECYGDSWAWTKGKDNFSGVTTDQLIGPAGLLHETRCPFQKANNLWVKEIHFRYGKWVKNGTTKTGRQAWRFKPKNDSIRYPEDMEDTFVRGGRKEGWHKRPSIFMPRWASRITLEITGVRVERVQEIDPRDCIDEGIDFKKHECGCETCARSSKLCPATGSSLIMEYSELWDSINGKKHPWKSNPWVWVITFKKI